MADKITLEYNCADEGSLDVRSAIAGMKLVGAWSEFLGRLRNTLKYSDKLTDREHLIVSNIRDIAWEVLAEEGVGDLVDEYGVSGVGDIPIPPTDIDWDDFVSIADEDEEDEDDDDEDDTCECCCHGE